jgi:protease I
MSLTGRRILIWVAPQYEDLELWYPRIRLEEEGAVVTVAGLDRETCRGKHGYPCRPDATADEVDPDDFDALVIPGGFAPDKLRRSARVLDVTRRIFEAGKPVAFICHAGWVPISARIVKGRRGTSVGAIRDDLENAGLLWEDSPVVVDGNLISSRNPGDLPQFMKALIGLMYAA